MDIAEKLDTTSGGNMGVMMGLMSAPQLGGFSPEQMEQFCDKTPNAEELWDMFKGKRDSHPEGEYNFSDFVREVIES